MGTGAATELKLTMRPPPCCRMMGRTARFIRTMPKKLTSNRRRASSVSVNSTAPEMPNPALLMRISMRPFSAMTCATAAFTCSSSVISHFKWVMPGTSLSRRLNS